MTEPTITAQMGLEARDQLTWVADRWGDLRAALQPGNSSALDGMPHHAEQHRAPINIHVSDLLHAIEQQTRKLAHVLLDETDDWQPTTSSMPGLLYDVAHRYGHWTAADTHTALTFLDWAEDTAHKVKRALTKPQPATYIGPCKTDMCDGELHLKPGHTTATCPHCGTETAWDDQREYIEKQFEQRLMTPTELTSALTVLGTPVPIGTIKSWIHRERLPEVVDGLYRISDAQRLALTRKVRGKVSA